MLSVDYVDDGSGYVGTNKRRIEDYREKALKRGYIPYAALSDRALDKLNIVKGIQPYILKDPQAKKDKKKPTLQKSP